MKKLFFLFFIIGIAVIYLFLLWQKQSAVFLPPAVRTPGSSFSYTFEEAPKESLQGKISSLSGEVKWISRTATVSAGLNPDTVLQQGETIETGKDSAVSLDFSGKGSMTIAADSAIDIVQTLPGNLVFRLISGEGVFSSTALSPASVRGLHLLAITDGGEMKIAVDGVTGKVTVLSINGVVKIGYNDLDYQSITLDLRAGETYEFDDTARKGSVQ